MSLLQMSLFGQTRLYDEILLKYPTFEVVFFSNFSFTKHDYAKYEFL